ncbi:PAS domain S-box protein [Cohnella fermenti]|uniref:histidine kinase n=2 Tax=Cohnella fermenti TaxID=2565925 RepID=A0A4S4CA55_9BACL|nr:PAS domain S-box protein [Cohnella fermenti]
MDIIAKQIGSTVEATQVSRKYMEDSAGVMLRNAALAAKERLDPNIANITNEELVRLSADLGVDHLSLWIRKDDGDIVIARSSDPNELGQSSRTWDYWFTAFNQLFDNREVTIEQGEKLLNYWTGPINFSTSSPDQVDKWGYYYDGSTDYLINPFINATQFLDFERSTGTEAVILKILDDNPEVLAITGFDPQFFGKEKIIKYKKGKPVYNLDVRDVVFGSYDYQDEEDASHIMDASSSKQIVTVRDSFEGERIVKTFIPIDASGNLVVGIVSDGEAIRQALNHQLMMQILISVALAAAALFASYFLAGFLLLPINRILETVNEMAKGRLNSRLEVRKMDELGKLSTRINAMGDSLEQQTSRLKESAEELRSMKQYLESFVNQTSDAIHVSDLDGNVMQVNKAFEAIYGWSESEVAHRSLDNVPAEQSGEFERIREVVLQGGAVADYETERYAKDGTLLDVSLTVSSIRDEEDRIIAIATISRNITERKKTEALLRQSEKLAVVGQLAAGFAHEIRNPLTTLRGFVQLYQKQGELQAVYLQLMMSELDRINHIVSELLIFAKPQAVRFQDAAVAEIVQDVVMLLEPQAKLADIQFSVDFKTELPIIRGEPNQLKQVFLNLFKNAMEAMPRGGRISVEGEALPGERGVAVRVLDQGEGIPEDALKRLGEPFYSTKPSGNGLGLMVSQQIIASHKGKMTFRSKLGQGTIVEVTLPLSGGSLLLEPGDGETAIA